VEEEEEVSAPADPWLRTCLNSQANHAKQQAIYEELTAAKRALISHRRLLDKEKAKRRELGAALAKAKLQQHELAATRHLVLVDECHNEIIAAKMQELQRMEGKYEEEVAMSLTYQFMADRLQSYVEEERGLLKGKERKLAELQKHVSDAQGKCREIQSALESEARLLGAKQGLLEVVLVLVLVLVVCYGPASSSVLWASLREGMGCDLLSPAG
jgi:hypothetical protein